MTSDSKGIPVPQFSIENPVSDDIREFFGWPQRFSTPIPEGYQCDTPDNDGWGEFQICRPPEEQPPQTTPNANQPPTVAPFTPVGPPLSDADRQLQEEIARTCPNSTGVERDILFHEEQQRRRWNEFAEEMNPGSTAPPAVTQDPPPVKPPRFNCEDEADRYNQDMEERLQGDWRKIKGNFGSTAAGSISTIDATFDSGAAIQPARRL